MTVTGGQCAGEFRKNTSNQRSCFKCTRYGHVGANGNHTNLNGKEKIFHANLLKYSIHHEGHASGDTPPGHDSVSSGSLVVVEEDEERRVAAMTTMAVKSYRSSVAGVAKKQRRT
ncbi:hypothetical protein PoB_004163700 [Plakobranchus ocellatus]|uniref:CCHC-type domain-containing protein n=1 Tax=Plakobranchus ocellatus TaxID=259542 RepID=A0AAV4B7J2_9GAST|nr:hypothetical protein PoB_004163700 [Plakobranchus ocellatus]